MTAPWNRTAVTSPGADPAYERRREIRWEPRGEGAMRVRFLLHGPLGTTQFLVQFSTEPYGDPLLDSTPAQGWDLGFHSVNEIGGATEMEECDVLGQGHCWYDGSSLQAERLAALFFTTGEEVVWEWLEDRYQHWLERGAAS